MKDALLFSFVKLYDTSMVASVRIARLLAEKYSLPTADASPARCITKAMEKPKTLFIISGAFAFVEDFRLAALADRIVHADTIVWIQNDYKFWPPKDEGTAESPFRKAFVQRKALGKRPTVVWSTCEKWAGNGNHYVNWNKLTFDPAYSERAVIARRIMATDDLFYYGSYRTHAGMRKKTVQRNGVKVWNGEREYFEGKDGRDAAFRRYFDLPLVPTTISSPSERFAEQFPFCKHEPAIKENFYDTIGKHGLGLYIEDKRSHDEFHSPANRFYEMLSAGLPMVFQPESVRMLGKDGYDVSAYVVKDAESVKHFMPRRNAIGEEQREAWAWMNYKSGLDDQIGKAYEETFK